ncbi:oxidoreductase [uncultured Friedmanniella sp.]|uniref:oxidoreductase n=1 Tax=uncultured Friedmanniella sp. TaxID=335381 RepID=UPI0035CBFF00
MVDHPPADPLAELARLEGVPSAVAAAIDSVDAVLRDRGLRAFGPEVMTSTLLIGARGNAALTDAPDTWLPGAVRLSAELTTLAAVIRVAPAQALARAHVLLARGVAPEDQLGRIRSDPATAARMAGLTALLTGARVGSALVLGAVAHAELATVAPFGSADGLVARVAEHLVLISSGVDPRGAVPVEAGHAADPEAYGRGLAAYRSGSVGGVRGWLVHCATAVGRGAELLGASSAG